MRRRLVLVAKVAVAAGLIYLLLRAKESPFAELGKLRQGWPWFLLAQVAYGGVLLLAAWRWRVLLRAQGLALGWRESTSLTLIGHFFNQFMLGSTGGDVVKAYYVASAMPEKRAVAVLTVFLDRALGLMVLVLIATLAVLLNLDLLDEYVELGDSKRIRFHVLALAPGAALLVALVGLYLFYAEPVRRSRWVRRAAGLVPFQNLARTLTEAAYLYKSRGRDVLVAVAISVGIHSTVVLTNILFVLSLRQEVASPASFLLLVPLAQVFMALPLTPASLGTAELAYDRLFQLIGLPSGILVSILQRATYYGWAALGCVAFLKRRSRAGLPLPNSCESARPVVLLRAAGSTTTGGTYRRKGSRGCSG